MQSPLLLTLINIGLEPKEAEVYLSVLKLGKASITDIAKTSDIKRTTVYEYVNKLTKDGLFHKTAQGKRMVYVAEDPAKLIKLLEHKRKQADSILQDLQDIYATASHKPHIKLYEGIDGIRSIYDEISNTPQTVYSTFSAEKLFSVFKEKDAKEFQTTIYNKGGQLKELIENNSAGRSYIKHLLPKEVGSAKLLPKDFEVSVDLIVAGDKVAMVSLVNLIGVIIENPEIAELQRNFIKFVRRNI